MKKFECGDVVMFESGELGLVMSPDMIGLLPSRFIRIQTEDNDYNNIMSPQLFYHEDCLINLGPL